MISKNEKNQVRQIISSPQWSVIERIANEICENIRSDSVVKDSEWDTLKAAVMNEGQIRGIKTFIQELYNTQNE